MRRIQEQRLQKLQGYLNSEEIVTCPQGYDFLQTILAWYQGHHSNENKDDLLSTYINELNYCYGRVKMEKGTLEIFTACTATIWHSEDKDVSGAIEIEISRRESP